MRKIGTVFANKSGYIISAGLHTDGRMSQYNISDRTLLDAIRAAIPHMVNANVDYLIQVPSHNFSVVVQIQGKGAIFCMTVVPKGNATPARPHLAQQNKVTEVVRVEVA